MSNDKGAPKIAPALKGNATLKTATGKTYKAGRKLNTEIISTSFVSLMRIRIEGEVYDGHFPTLAKNENKTIPCVLVTDLDDGQLKTLLVPAVFRSILQGMGEPIGKCFQLEVGALVKGKNYREIEVTELEEG